jgi:hypothetical protein
MSRIETTTTHQNIQHRRRDVAYRRRVLLQLLLLLLLPRLLLRRLVLLRDLRARLERQPRARHDERHGVRRVRGVRVARRGIAHLLRVAVVRGDEEHVAVLLGGFVDGAHGFVGRGDGLDGGVVDARVTDLFIIHE